MPVSMSDPKKDVAPEPDLVEEDDEPALPEADEAATLQLDEAGAGSLAAGRDAIVHAIKEAPSRPGVYRMIDGRGDVLYVGKAKNIKKRIAAYARPTGLDTRIERMIAQTRTLEFVVTRTETEALLLEANATCPRDHCPKADWRRCRAPRCFRICGAQWSEVIRI